MIISAFIITPDRRVACKMEIAAHKVVFDLREMTGEPSFDLEINLESTIEAVRTHDYHWANPAADCICAAFSPKVARLSNGKYLQPSVQTGIWETRKANHKQLLWRFNPDGAAPLTVYGEGHIKQTVKANIVFPGSVSLLFAVDAVEFSRSPIPFSAVACFTDHCDFDTLDSLIRQREFFKKAGIKVTKGFFLNHFSKRKDNASFEHHRDEFEKWRADGHELAYHSLSQSIKSDADSSDDFDSFNPPYPDLPTWIDHGFQPYNLSLYAHSLDDASYAEILGRKNIATLWNYVDSGTSTTGVINQLNPDDFTLSRFVAGNSGLGLKTRLAQLIKNIMFHYYADEKIIARYKSAAGNAKKLIYQRQLKSIWPLVGNFSGLSVPVLAVFANWRKSKNRPYKLAKYSPLVFTHRISGKEFKVFQTIEMVDFVKSLAPGNVKKLVAESGLFIAHTYFSVPASYHHGRMFSAPNAINSAVAANFEYLGSKIQNNEVWNPTLNELVTFLANFEKTTLDVDAGGHVTVFESGLPYRTIT